MVNGIESYEFQENCVDFLYDKTTASGTKASHSIATWLLLNVKSERYRLLIVIG